MNFVECISSHCSLRLIATVVTFGLFGGQAQDLMIFRRLGKQEKSLMLFGPDIGHDCVTLDFLFLDVAVNVC